MRFLTYPAIYLICIFFLACSPLSASKHRKDVPEAPVPTSVSAAKKVFVTNGGGSNLAFDEFYSQIRQWNHFEIVGSPSEADIIIELKIFCRESWESSLECD
jgi:hypothetical protein